MAPGEIDCQGAPTLPAWPAITFEARPWTRWWWHGSAVTPSGLEVYVTNLMANRIADLDRRGISWKKFYNDNFPSRLAQNRGANGLFDAYRWSPLPSGLLGQVTLTPLASFLA